MSENSKVAESDLFNEQGISCIEILVSNFDASQYCCKRMKQSLPLVGIYNTNVYGKISSGPLNILKYFEQCIMGKQNIFQLHKQMQVLFLHVQKNT